MPPCAPCPPILGMAYSLLSVCSVTLPSFSGEPVAIEVPELDAAALAEKIWHALNSDNRVSLYVCVGGEEDIINKYGEEA